MGGDSSPAVVNGVVYVGSSDLHAIDAATGTARWSFKTGGIMDSSPAVVNGFVYVGSLDHYIYAIDAATGTAKWSFKTGGRVRSSPAVVNDVLYIQSGDRNVYAIGSEHITCHVQGDYSGSRNYDRTVGHSR